MHPSPMTMGELPDLADKGFIPIRLYEYFHNLLDEINNHESFGLTQ
jgi:hypothetical protein